MRDRTLAALIVLLAVGFFFLAPSVMGSGPSYYQTLQDEGVDLTQRDTLNFTGAGVTCADDGGTKTTCTITGGSGGSVILDLADDGSNESDALTEIATTGDTNGIFTEPSADKLLIDLTKDWPRSDLADALAANAANCAAGQAAGGVDATGAVESCIDPLLSTELDSETELETLLADVSNVFTNNDTIDISANTNLAANSPVTLTGDTVGLGTVDISGNTNLAVSSPIVLTDDTLSLNQNGGTDVTVDLEEEAHASEHASGGADVLYHNGKYVWVYQGNLSAETMVVKFVLDGAVTYGKTECYINTAPTGSVVQVNIQEGGTDIYSDGNRVEVAIAANSDESGSPTDTTGANGDVLSLIIDAVDSGDTGANMTCILHYTQALSN